MKSDKILEKLISLEENMMAGFVRLEAKLETKVDKSEFKDLSDKVARLDGNIQSIEQRLILMTSTLVRLEEKLETKLDKSDFKEIYFNDRDYIVSILERLDPIRTNKYNLENPLDWNFYKI